MDPLEGLEPVATRGDTAAFHTMLGNDPLLLEKATLFPATDNILHIASVAGNLDFVRIILRLKPGFAWDGNKDGLTPLHMASALGHDEIVGALLLVGRADLCLLQDNQGRTPLHYAAINGKIPVIEVLLLTCPEALEIKTSKGETALHLALKNKQANAFRRLVQGLRHDRWLFLKYRKSIQQLAKETNQLQELDVLDVFPTRFQVFFTLLKRNLWLSTIYMDPQISQVVASLIATITFQAAVNPPPALWDKEKQTSYYKCRHRKVGYSLQSQGKNICGDSFPAAYTFFMVFNSVGFFSSVIFLMFFKTGRIGRFIMAASLMALICSYITVLMAMSHDAILSTGILCASFLGLVAIGAASADSLRLQNFF